MRMFIYKLVGNKYYFYQYALVIIIRPGYQVNLQLRVNPKNRF